MVDLSKAKVSWVEGVPGPELCRARPSPRSTARCEMYLGHDGGNPYEGTSPEAAEFLASFHAGRTRGGYWKFWAAEKPEPAP